jgi:predicted RNase H-like HicB family nuclease
MHRFNYAVRWYDEDGEYVATCAEFPSLSYLDPDPAKALVGLVDIVQGVVDDMTAAEELIPSSRYVQTGPRDPSDPIDPLVHYHSNRDGMTMRELDRMALPEPLLTPKPLA